MERNEIPGSFLRPFLRQPKPPEPDAAIESETRAALYIEDGWEASGRRPDIYCSALKMILLHHLGNGSGKSDQIVAAVDILQKAMELPGRDKA